LYQYVIYLIHKIKKETAAEKSGRGAVEACLPWEQEVAGSNPAVPTIFTSTKQKERRKTK
jgi:hypothetical protein